MFDIEPFVNRQFGMVRAYGNPQSDFRVECPFCHDIYGSPDTSGKLHISINPDKPLVHCFRCGYSTNWFGLVRHMTGARHTDILKELYVAPSISDFESVAKKFKKSEQSITKEIPKVTLPDDFVPLLQDNTLPLIKRTKQYLLARGINYTDWKKYNLGVAPSQGMRVIIPIEDDYWQGRRILDWIEPKYTNPKAESAGVIFNSTALSYNEVVICEGAFSAMAVGDNAVAILRKDATSMQVRRFIGSDVSRFILALEPDAFPSMKKLADRLVSGNKEVIIWKYEDGDPAEYTKPPEIIQYNLKSKIELLLNAS